MACGECSGHQGTAEVRPDFQVTVEVISVRGRNNIEHVSVSHAETSVMSKMILHRANDYFYK